jgi:Right handed beta helix region
MAYKTIPFALFFFCLFHTKAQDTVNISSFGYVPDSRVNAVPFVKKALEACRNKKNTVLIFPKGRYDFFPQYSEEKMYYESNSDVIPLRRCPILIEGFKNLTIDGMGSDFIYHDRVQPITIDNSQNITIRNISIDWDVPIMAQGQIVAITNTSIDVAINIESPYKIENEKIFFLGEGWKSELNDAMEFDKETKFISQGCGDGCLGNEFYSYKANEIGPGIVRINYQMSRKPGLGNYLALRHSARDHAGTFIVNSRNVTIENLKMHQNSGLGILSQYSENLTFNNVHCVPNPKKNRVFAGHDDGLHFSNCKGQISVNQCRFLGLMDDPINVHGTSVQIIEKITGKKLLCKFMHDQSIGTVWARPGEKIAFIENESMHTFGRGVVESFVARNAREFEITFKEPLPPGTSVGDALENLTWSPDVLIKNSFFGNCRARGILVTTPGKVVIENNVFESSGTAILIAGDANGWFESGGVKDVLIRNNVFNDVCLTSVYQFCEAIISIYPEIPKMNSSKPFHRNIRIEKNTFNPFDYPVLYAKSTEGLSFNDNIINHTTRFKPFHQRKFMITLEACKKVEVLRNKLDKAVLGKNIKLVATPPADLKLGKKQRIYIEH